MIKRPILSILLLLISGSVLFACGSKKSSTNLEFEEIDDSTPTPYIDEFAGQKINIVKTYNINDEFKVDFKTTNGVGTAEFKAGSIKEISAAGKKTPPEGKKLVLVEISIKGNKQNTGQPSTFNQVGDTPSPQFVLINQKSNLSLVEETYYSDGYTEDKKLFELSKITLDHDQWVHTALVFAINSDQSPKLAFRYVDPEGKTNFYAIE
ncbi:MAG: hypothetical protein WC596_02220 [Candidatus Shapirobacteria bacterium]